MGTGHDDIERTSRKHEELLNEILNVDFSSSSTSSSYRGNNMTTNLPENIEISEIDDSLETEGEENTQEFMISDSKAERLENEYMILNEGGGMELLEVLHPELETSYTMDDFEETLLELMSVHGLIEYSDSVEITPRGRQMGIKWASFRDNYLTGETCENRLNTVEEEIGEIGMPAYLEETSGIAPDLDRYLRKKEIFKSRYDPEMEFRELMSSIYGQGSGKGQRVRSLEILNNPEKYDVEQVPEKIMQDFDQTGVLGLLDRKDVLNFDGEALYNRVRTDALYL